jgi:hypothetical protein
MTLENKMAGRFDDYITIMAQGTTVTTGAASANTTIPSAADGNKPRYIRVAATTESYIKLGVAGVAATTNDIMVQPADAVILHVPNNVTNIAYIQGTAAGKVNITPLEQI